jgi:hypothetical protein
MKNKAEIAERVALIWHTLALHHNGLHSGEISQLTTRPFCLPAALVPVLPRP